MEIYLENGKLVGGKLSMLIVLPNGDQTLTSLLRSLSETPIARVMDFLKRSKEEFNDSSVHVRLPRFKISTSLQLANILQNMGVKDAFDSEHANLEGISSDPLYVTKVSHKTEIEVDEEGSTGSSATVLEGNRMSMVAILPATGQPLSSILDAMSRTKSSISSLVENLNRTRDSFSPTEVVVRLPKFKIASALNLNAVLDAMGSKDVFNSEHSNLRGISSTAALYVSRVLHRTEIEVDEDGTVGSSVTVVEVTDRISDMDYFSADKPFAYFVYDKLTKSLIFAGKYSSPQV